MRSLSSAVSGLRNQQTRMDVIGNNISNVNTTAFKAGRVTFKEGFAQLVSSAQRPDANTGGTNPVQIGLGSQIGTVDNLFTQGNLETTGQNTDLAIQGSSFFLVKKEGQEFYTRAGNFQTDAAGNLISGSSGAKVQGRMAVAGKFVDGVTDLKIPIGQTTPASATTSISLSGNLDASAAPFSKGTAATLDALDPVQRALPANAGAFKDLTITAYDSLGTRHEVKAVAWKTGVNTWDWKFDSTGAGATPAGVTETAGTHPITFLADGSVDPTTVPPTISLTPVGGGSPMTIAINFGAGLSGLSQFAGLSSAVMRDQNGYADGSLQSFTIDPTGTILGSFTNGTSQALGQVILGDFNNPSGLSRVGDNLYTQTGNSGAAVLGYSGEGSTSSIAAGALEMSNVDLAQEFTDMIVAQRGFQANGKVITTSDQMLDDLMQLKR